jgi:EpsI family protein
MSTSAIGAVNVSPMGTRAVWWALAITVSVAAFHAADMWSLGSTWRASYTYSHGFLVAALVPWLIWRERDTLGFERQTPFLATCAVLAGLGLAWLLARGAHIDVISSALLPPIAWVAVAAALGPLAARRLAFPLGWFWCAVPIWDGIGGPLQRMTALVDRVLLEALGIPALLERSTITVPAGSFEIASSCSGLNFFVVAVTLVALIGHVRRWSVWRRVGYVALGALVAASANWVRVLIIIVEGQRTQMQTPLVREGHYTFGWWLFAAILGVFLYLTHRWDRAEAPPAPPFAAPTAPAGTAARRVAVVLALVAMAPLWAALQEARAHARPAPVVELPAGRGSWSGPSATPRLAWRPTFVGATTEVAGAYASARDAVLVDVTYYAAQRPGAKLIGYPSNVDGPEGSTVLTRKKRELRFGPGPVGDGAIEEVVVQTADGARWQVWHWFQVGTAIAAQSVGLKVLESAASLVGESGSAAVSIAIACDGECREDREGSVLKRFWLDMQQSLVMAAAGDSAHNGQRVR